MADKILIVDDEKLICDLLVEFLTREGYKVAVATCLKDAVKFMDDSAFKLAFVDLKLPDGDGIGVISTLRANNPKLKAVIMTGFPTDRSREQAKKLGVIAYISKPFQLSQIQKILDSAK